MYSLPTSQGFCWICLTDDVAFGVAEVRGMQTAPLLNMTGMEEEVLWYWGGIFVRSRTELLVLNGALTGQRYINEVLQPVVLPFVKQHHVVLQDDNARPHRARIVQQFLQQNNVDHLDWPARSPDLSPIEHVWDILGKRIRQRVPRPRMLQALGAALQEEWKRIPQLQIARFIRSMHRRCVACIDATGGHTRYWQICEVLLGTLVIFHTNFLIHI